MRPVSDDAPPVHVLRSRPEDFVVIEEPLYPASGSGKHLFLCVEKRGRTTEQVARDLARVAGIPGRDVGYAGRKDRHALTQQWFSLPGVDPERALSFEIPGARVLEARRHEHKLKTGHLRGNRFEIVLRGEGSEAIDVVQQRASELVRRGMPNRYGAQRFGREGDNAERARQMLATGRAPRDRRAARFLLSALQSEVFNAVLEERREALDSVELGDLARVEQSGGLFWVDDLERDRARAAAFEISATGPIFGTRMRAPTGEIAALEQAVFDRFGLPAPEAFRLPRGLRARGGRRPLRVRPEALVIEPLESEPGLRVYCGLPSGAYVTVLLESLVGPVRDAHAPSRRDDVGSDDVRRESGVCSEGSTMTGSNAPASVPGQLPGE